MRVLLTILLLCIGSAALAGQAVVSESKVRLRADGSEHSRVVGSLDAGTKVDILSEAGDYSRVRTAEGKEGWVASRLLDKVEAEPAPAGDGEGSQETDSDKRRLEAFVVALKKAEQNLEAKNGQVAVLTERVDELEVRQWMVASIFFILGIVVGLLFRESYYRRKLHGLRV